MFTKCPLDFWEILERSNFKKSKVNYSKNKEFIFTTSCLTLSLLISYCCIESSNKKI